MEAVGGMDERRRVGDAAAAAAEATPAARTNNPYANGYMGAANGSKRTAALWRRNRITPINSPHVQIVQEAR